MNKIAQAVDRIQKSGGRLLPFHSPDYNFAASFWPDSSVKNAFEKFLTKPHYYPDPLGAPEARAAISGFYSNFFARRVSENDLLITSGSSESYAWILRLLCESGDSVLVPMPGYPLLEHLADYARIRVIPYNLKTDANDFKIDFDSIQVQQDTKAIVIISPHNPTGHVISQDELSQISKLARDHNIAVILDEVFSSFVWQSDLARDRFPAFIDAPLVFTLNGTSKLLALPWMKLSWIHMQGEGSRIFKDKIEFLSDAFLSVNSLSQSALPELLALFPSFHNSLMGGLRTNLAKLSAAFSGAGISPNAPQGGQAIIGSLPDSNLSEEDLVLELLERGIHLYPGYYFDLPGNHLVGAFCQTSEAILELATVLSSLR